MNLESKTSDIKRTVLTSFTVFFLIAATRAFGMLRNILIAKYWGMGEAALSFETAFSVQASIFDLLFGAALSIMFIPHFNRYLTEKGSEEAKLFAGRILGTLTVLLMLFFSLCAVFSGIICRIFAGGLSRDALNSASLSAGILFVLPVITGVFAIYTGILQSFNRPEIPALTSLAASAITLICITFSRGRMSVYTLCTVIVLSNLIMLLATAAFTSRIGFAVRPRFFPSLFNVNNIKKVFGVLAFSSYIPISVLISTAFSSNVADGKGIAATGYAWRGAYLVSGLFSFVVHAMFYAKMSRAKSDRAKAKISGKLILVLFMITLPIAVVFFVFPRQIIAFLYQRGEFSADNTLLTANALKYYALSIPLLVTLSIQTETAYIIGRQRRLIAGAFSSILINLLMLAVLPDSMLAGRISLAFSVSALYFVLFNFVFVRITRAVVGTDRLMLMLALTDKNIGGAGIQLLNYLKNADIRQYDICVVLPRESMLAESVRMLGFPVIESCGERSFSIKGTIDYITIIRKVNPDIVHANACLSARIASFLCRVRVRVYTRHCVYAVNKAESGFPVRQLNSIFTRILSTGVIAVAHSAENNLISMGVPGNMITVIHNGVPEIKQNADLRAQIRNAYGFGNALVCGICGRLETDKGHIYLLKAAYLLKKRNTDVKFLIVGNGSLENQLHTLAENLSLSDTVFFCGFCKDVSPYLNAMDIYINCSVGTEAASLAIAEAMSLALPIIATDYGGNCELVSDGRNGIIIPQKNPCLLAQAINTLGDIDLRRQMGAISKEIYASEFCASKMAQNNEALYINLYNRKRLNKSSQGN